MPPNAHKPALPDWHPAWARELADLYFSGTTCLFVLHGNVHDLIPCPEDGRTAYCNLPDFLAAQLFGSWDLVLHYDLARGLRALAGGDAERLQGMVRRLTASLGEPASWPRDPDAVFLLLDKFIERTLLEEGPSRRPSLAVVSIMRSTWCRPATSAAWGAARARTWSACSAGRKTPTSSAST